MLSGLRHATAGTASPGWRAIAHERRKILASAVVVQRSDRLSADEGDAMGRRGSESVVEQFCFSAYSRRLERLIDRVTQVVKGP